MIVCVPVMPDGSIDPRWGRAQCVAVANVADGVVASWQEYDVGWGTSHDAAPEGQHHANIARFLKEHGVQRVVANHMGDGMRQMLASMRIDVHLGAAGSARKAVL